MILLLTISSMRGSTPFPVPHLGGNRTLGSGWVQNAWGGELEPKWVNKNPFDSRANGIVHYVHKPIHALPGSTFFQGRNLGEMYNSAKCTTVRKRGAATAAERKT